jgi:hypothetical protein
LTHFNLCWQEEVTLEVMSRMTSDQLKEVGIQHLGARLRILDAFKARNGQPAAH